MTKIMTALKVPPEVAPFMERHGKRATKALVDFLKPCSSLDEKLGALGAFAQVLVALGDSLQAQQLSQHKGQKQ